MLPATDFFQFWGLAFLTLSVSLVLLSVFYRLIDTDLGLHSLRKEAVIATVASLAQGAGLWFTASLIPGGFRRQIIPGMIVAIIYILTHLEDWRGNEMGGIFLFQMVIWNVGFFMLAGEFKIAAIILVASRSGWRSSLVSQRAYETHDFWA